MAINPFTYGNPISNPARFFGRLREVEQVFSRLRNAEAESSSLVGERRVGKTSLLHFLSHPDTRRRYGLNPDQYIFVYTDLQMVDSSVTPARLAQRLMRQMAQQCEDAEVKQMVEELRQVEVIDNFALADLFDAIDQKDLHVVFLLDEFEKVTANPNFGPDFFYGLRSLAIQHNLTLITSSRSELIELTHSEVIRSSPFFNIFANINVGLFSEAEALQLIDTSLNGSGVRFTDSELAAIFRLAGFHPFFIQAACFFLFEAYSNDLDSAAREKYLIKEFGEEARPHFDNYWYNSSDNEKIVLTALALLEREGRAGKRSFSLDQLQDLYTRSGQTLAHLEKRSLLTNKDGGYALLNSTLGDWIIHEISGTMSDQHRYEDWLKSHESAMERLSGKARTEIAEILPKVNARYRDLIITWASDPRNLISVAALLRTALGLGM